MNCKTDNPFWQDMLQRYSNKDLEQVCLSLQDAHQINVVFLLWLVWLRIDSRPISDSVLEDAQVLSEHLERCYLHPLRLIRRKAKQDPLLGSAQQLVRHILRDNELQLERELADRLFNLSNEFTGVGSNNILENYLMRKGVKDYEFYVDQFI